MSQVTQFHSKQKKEEKEAKSDGKAEKELALALKREEWLRWNLDPSFREILGKD